MARELSLIVVEQANTIITEYLVQEFWLTLRQLFDQFVARSLLENNFKQYKRLGNVIRNARDGGLVDRDAIEDRTREVSLWRWDRDPEMVALGWPPPVYIRKRKYRGRKLLEKFKALLLRRAIKARGT
jgi:hypothetical protein